jgi:hypothetical protein
MTNAADIPNSISIENDTLIPDSELAKLWHCHDRTLYRYDKEPDGLPFCYIGGKKYRPLRACSEWLARRVKYPNPTRRKGAK